MGIFNKLINGLKKTKTSLADKLKYVVSKNELDDEFFEELEYVLLSSDIDPETVDSIIEEMRERAKRALTKKSEDAKQILKEILVERLRDNDDNLEDYKFPLVIMVVGVNGVGKTTTIGKLASMFASQKKSVVIAAADTFRAAASDQLEVWANRANVRIIRSEEGTDAGAVVFDAIKSAKAKNADVVIIDSIMTLPANEPVLTTAVVFATFAFFMFSSISSSILSIRIPNSSNNCMSSFLNSLTFSLFQL